MLFFHANQVNASNAPATPATQQSSESSSSKDSKKSFWDITTLITAKTLAIGNNAYAVYTAASVTALMTFYGGYQLWRKFIFDSQLRAMQEEFKREIARSTQDTNKHITNEIHTSETKQMQHTTDKTRELHQALIQHINTVEKNVTQHIDTSAHTINTTIKDMHKKQNELSEQLITNHQEIITRLDKKSYPPRIPFSLKHIIAGVISLVMLASACYCKSSCCDEVACSKCGLNPCTCSHMTRHHNKI